MRLRGKIMMILGILICITFFILMILLPGIYLLASGAIVGIGIAGVGYIISSERLPIKQERALMVFVVVTIVSIFVFLIHFFVGWK